jgi:hypothetical protein
MWFSSVVSLFQSRKVDPTLKQIIAVMEKTSRRTVEYWPLTTSVRYKISTSHYLSGIPPLYITMMTH